MTELDMLARLSSENSIKFKKFVASLELDYERDWDNSKNTNGQDGINLALYEGKTNPQGKKGLGTPHRH